MATQLIKHLEDCAKDDASYRHLKAQWAFDETLIAKTLQNVSAYFPHYSRHDDSHSRQILVHIERLLGAANIAKLSATDTWLLLEAAYLHDIGMVITDAQLNKDFGAIKKHVEKTKHSAHGDTLILMDALLASKIDTASSVFATVDFSPLYTVKLLREIVADFYRSQHPDRAQAIIAQPFAEIGLNSPRTELIPDRLFRLLGKICAYHGKPFAEVMQLPQQQVGIGTYDCHPRFIACLLRLGDLLDLDDNRFCPVMMKMAGDLPTTSQAHYDKHLSIRYFRADTDRIEIEAECPSYESYIETTNWFGWLREEVKNQMSRWFDIVPSHDFGFLPSVGALKPQLKDWQVFNENERPHFTLDRDRIFELLQGAGLYENKEQAMRELLQNAVDATLIRIWREHGEDCTPQPKPYLKRDSAPRSKETLDILSRYTIDVSIEKEKEEERYNYWRITITDPGTGISKDDLEFMLKMGSSKKNPKKRAIIDQMPIWMKPSGIFGIGFHSVFLLTDEVRLETRSVDTGETLLIRVTNPTNQKEQGNVYFRVITEPTSIELNNPNEKEKTKTVKPWDFSNYGCQLSFIYKTDRVNFPKHRDAYKQNELIASLQHYDGLIDLTRDFHIDTLISSISNFFIKRSSSDEEKSDFIYSLLKGNLKFNGKADKFYDEIPENWSSEHPDYYYLPDEKLELLKLFPDRRLIMPPKPNSIKFYYRGATLYDSNMLFHFIKVIVNLLDDKADEIITINRNWLKDCEEKEEIYMRVYNAIQKFFKTSKGENFYNSLNENEKVKLAAEYALQEWQQPPYWNGFSWDNLEIKTKQPNENENENEKISKINTLKTYKTILCFSSSIFNIPQYKQKLDELLSQNSNEVISIPVNQHDSGHRLLNRFLKENGFKATNSMENEFDVVEISKEEKEPISPETMHTYCEKILRETNLYRDFLKRRSIPCLKDYVCLELNNPYILPILEVENSEHPINLSFPLDLISPRMLFPLARIGDRITEGDLDILAKRVYKNRAHKNISKEQIQEKYQEFIAFLDKLMQGNRKWVESRGTEFVHAPTESAKTD